MNYTVGIIGHGHFGAFVERLCVEYAPEVSIKIYSRAQTPDNQRFFSLQEVCESDVLVLAVPIKAFEAVLQEILPLVRKETILIDVATVKTHTAALLKKAAQQNPGLLYIATHPMFGPFSFEKKGNSLSGLRLVVCEHTLSEKEYARCKELLSVTGVKILEMKPEAHDTMLAETLFLTHYIGQIVHKGGFERTQIDTVSFGFLMDAVESVREDEQLFQDVYRFNPFCKDVIQRFERAEAETEQLLARTLNSPSEH